ncbi:MAG: XRE family transcriptional regulator [Alphaproteobacteria bacterium]|nr:XRE family transcriptional regulator [Alphaproteobacteria bacterium]
MNPETVRPNAITRPLRVAAGQWLKSLREAKGLTQRALAEQVELRYYTFISQIEGGYGKIPSEQYPAWANALGVDQQEFAKQLIYYYDPVLYRMLFGQTGNLEVDPGLLDTSPSGTTRQGA